MYLSLSLFLSLSLPLSLSLSFLLVSSCVLDGIIGSIPCDYIDGLIDKNPCRNATQLLSCVLITLIKCLKGHKSLASLFEGVN